MVSLDLKDHFIKALKKIPHFSEAHLQLALLYKEEGNHNNVVKHFEMAISSDIDEYKRLERKGEELLKKFQFQNAKEKFLKKRKSIIFILKWQTLIHFLYLKIQKKSLNWNLKI